MPGVDDAVPPPLNNTVSSLESLSPPPLPLFGFCAVGYEKAVWIRSQSQPATAASSATATSQTGADQSKPASDSKTRAKRPRAKRHVLSSAIYCFGGQNADTRECSDLMLKYDI